MKRSEETAFRTEFWSKPATFIIGRLVSAAGSANVFCRLRALYKGEPRIVKLIDQAAETYYRMKEKKL